MDKHAEWFVHISTFKPKRQILWWRYKYTTSGLNEQGGKFKKNETEVSFLVQKAKVQEKKHGNSYLTMLRGPERWLQSRLSSVIHSFCLLIRYWCLTLFYSSVFHTLFSSSSTFHLSNTDFFFFRNNTETFRKGKKKSTTWMTSQRTTRESDDLAVRMLGGLADLQRTQCQVLCDRGS